MKSILNFLILFNLNLQTVCLNNFWITRRNLMSGSLLYPNLAVNNIDLMGGDDNDSYKLIKKNNNFYLTGSINEQSCLHLGQSLIHYNDYLKSNSDNELQDHINLYIQSPGGSLLPTFGLVDEILNLDTPVYTYIKGYAASAATLISVVGNKRYMYKHSLMMIHSVKLGNNSPENYLEVKDLNKNVDQFMNIIENIYLENSNISTKILREMFNHDCWIDSETALKYNLIDYIID